MTMEEEIHIRLPLNEVRAWLNGADPKTIMGRVEDAVESYDQAQAQAAAELAETGAEFEDEKPEEVGFVVLAPDLGNTDPNAKNLVERIRFSKPIEKRNGEAMEINLDHEKGIATVYRWPIDDPSLSVPAK
jgi:hypothetical protein